MRFLWLGFVAACTSSSGGPAPDPPCVQDLPASCQPTYDPPTWSTIHAKILAPTCATGKGTCHTPDFAPNGLVLADADASYAMLLDGRRVLPNNPSCSLLVKRLTSSDPSYRMPRGPTPLSAGDLCTITTWIANGAAK
ncbi:MAG TPA: c-type cytochrome domain-containing protein [Labilithrix sp.]